MEMGNATRGRLSRGTSLNDSCVKTLPILNAALYESDERGAAHHASEEQSSSYSDWIHLQTLRGEQQHRERPANSERRRSAWIFFIVLICVVVVLFTAQAGYIDSGTAASFDAKQDLGSAASSPGEAQSSASHDPILVESLDISLLPGDHDHDTSKKKRDRRLIFIGDIHGCIHELEKLLKKADYNHEKDHIIAAGDMINKGPDSKAVLDFLSHRKASCVRGNHDNLILRKLDELESVLPDGMAATLDAETQLASSLTQKQIRYLRACPVILRVGQIHETNFVVVHGGLVPSLAIEQQNPNDVMNMRIIDERTHEPSSEHEKAGFVPWTNLWNDYQERLLEIPELSTRPVNNGITVVYGHDAKKGLQVKRFTRGLDSGCVKGKKLSALIVNSRGKEEILQVTCREYI